MLCGSESSLVQLIEQKCHKFQYDEAETWAEFLTVVSVDQELAQYTMGYVYLLQSKLGSAVHALKKCKSAKARFTLSQCYLKFGRLQDSLDCIENIEKSLPESSAPEGFFDFLLTKSDIYKLRSQIYFAMGKRASSCELSKSAFFSDPSLLMCLKSTTTDGEAPQTSDFNF